MKRSKKSQNKKNKSKFSTRAHDRLIKKTSTFTELPLDLKKYINILALNGAFAFTTKDSGLPKNKEFYTTEYFAMYISQEMFNENILLHPNLKNLTVWFHKTPITYIPGPLLYLQILNIRGSSVVKLPDSLPSLKYLDCRRTLVEKLPDHLERLIDLRCSWSSIKKLPDTLYNLMRLECENTPLEELPSNLDHLKFVLCSRQLRIPDYLLEKHRNKKLNIKYV